MLREEIKQLKTGSRDLRKFGLAVGGALSLLGLWILYRHEAQYLYFLYPGVLLLILGLTIPKSLKQVYIGWMALAFCLGLVVSTLLLTVFFYLVVTPIGLAARCCGKDFLERRLDTKATTYWLARIIPNPAGRLITNSSFSEVLQRSSRTRSRISAHLPGQRPLLGGRIGAS